MPLSDFFHKLFLSFLHFGMKHGNSTRTDSLAVFQDSFMHRCTAAVVNVLGRARILG